MELRCIPIYSQSSSPCSVPFFTAAYSLFSYSRGFHSNETILVFFYFKILSARSLIWSMAWTLMVTLCSTWNPKLILWFTHELWLSFDNLIFGFDIWIIHFNDIFTVGFLFSMSLTEFSCKLFDLIGNFKCLIHDINQTGSFSSNYQAKFNVIFLLLIFILN